MLRTVLFAGWVVVLLTACAVQPASPARAAQQRGPVRWAYYVPDDPASLRSLQQRSGDLDYVALHWAAMREDGSLEIKANPDVTKLVRSLGARPILSVTAASPEAAHAFLSSDSLRAAAIDNLAAATSDYDGISIDFEGLYPEDRSALTQFVAQMAGRLRAASKLVTMALPAKASDTRTGWAGAVDYAALAPHGDLFVLMAYGYRTARSSAPGSTAPLPWVESTLSFALSQIPREKILLGIPLYGYDWDTTSGPPAKALRHPDAVALASQEGAVVQHDPVQQSAFFAYARDGHSHEVWFEDRASLQAKLALVSSRGLAGVSLWRLGHEDPDVWQVINNLSGTGSQPQGSVPDPPASTPSAVDSQGGNRSWYLAEGSTASPFDTWILLQNPNASPASVRLTLMLDGGGRVTRELTVAATSRVSIFVNQLVPNAAFSSYIESSQPLLVERAMYAGFDGHVVTAVASPSRRWYFADGATSSPFHTWILLQNPNAVPAIARVSFLTEDGTIVPREVFLPPSSRTSIFVNQLLPNSAFSTCVESDQPIVAERAMYRFPGNAATGVTGVSSPSQTWYFGAGLPTFRDMPVDSWLLLQNPNGAPVTATVTFYGTDGQVATFQQSLPPTSRRSLFINQLFSVPSFGIKVEASGPIVAERSVFLGPTAVSNNEPQGAYATQGAPSLGTVWALAEGSTAPPFSEKISILNPHDSPMQVNLELMLENGEVVSRSTTLGAARSLDLDMGTLIRSASFSARVTTSLPSVVERTMFWVKNGRTGAHDTIGFRLG